MSGPAFGFLVIARPPGSGAEVEVANGRLERGIWPLYERTRNRDALVPGARVAIYVGRKAQIIATAVVQEVITPGRRGIQVDAPEFLTPPASRVLRLSRIVRLDTPVQFHDPRKAQDRSEEHTSELQSPDHLVCRLLLEKKKTKR